MYTAALTQLVVIIARDDLLRRRLTSILEEDGQGKYPAKAFASFSAFLESGYDQEAVAFIAADEGQSLQALATWQQQKQILLPVIAIRDGSLEGSKEFTGVLLSETFELSQVRDDLILTTMKYLMEVGAVIGEMKALQDAIELSEQTNNRFFQYMSHELSSPLQAAKTLQQNISVLTDINEIKANARITALAITHVLDAINNISEYVRVSKKQVSMNQEEFSVKPVIEDLVSLFDEHAAHKNISIHATYPRDEDCYYHGDKLRLRQILVNLIKNAIKFTDQGTISIAVARHATDMWISVTDTGIGMSDALVSDIMSRNSYTPGTGFDGGLGIGLKLSREFLEMAGGRLEVSSKLGKGSIFTTVLPNECYLNEPETKLSIAG